MSDFYTYDGIRKGPYKVTFYVKKLEIKNRKKHESIRPLCITGTTHSVL